MKLYFRTNKVTDADKKIITVLGRFQGGTVRATRVEHSRRFLS